MWISLGAGAASASPGGRRALRSGGSSEGRRGRASADALAVAVDGVGFDEVGGVFAEGDGEAAAVGGRVAFLDRRQEDEACPRVAGRKEFPAAGVGDLGGAELEGFPFAIGGGVAGFGEGLVIDGAALGDCAPRMESRASRRSAARM